MIIEYILVIVALIWVLAASIFDVKTTEVPNWLSYSLISIGLGLRLINSIYLNNYWFFFYGLIGFGIMFVIGMIMYYTKQWGGGDSKLLMGLGAVFGSNLKTFLNPVVDFPFLAVLVFNILITGGFYGIVFGIILSIKNKKKFISEFKKVNLIEIKVAFIISLVLIFILSIFIPSLFLYWIIFGFLIMLLSVLLVFMRLVERSCMYKKININKLVEGDWVAEDIIFNKKIICSKKDLELTKEQINKLKKLKIKKVLVKVGIPFVPSFLMGLLITLIFGNILRFII